MTVAAVLGLAGLLALGKKIVDFAKMLTNWRTEKSGAVTQAVAWAVFVALVFLYGAAQTGARVELVPGLSLADLNGWAKLILGLQIGSGAGIVTDWLQARDNHDSQAFPPLRLPRLASLRAHPAEQPWQAEAPGPILPPAAVVVRPELDPLSVDRMRADLHDALVSVADAVVADVADRVREAATPPPAEPTPEPPAEPEASPQPA